MVTGLTGEMNHADEDGTWNIIYPPFAMGALFNLLDICINRAFPRHQGDV
jgi:hypothetical protein